MIGDPGVYLSTVLGEVGDCAQPRLVAVLSATNAVSDRRDRRLVELGLEPLTATPDISAGIDTVLAPIVTTIVDQADAVVGLIVVDADPFRGHRHRYRLLFEVSRTRLGEHDATLTDLWIVTGQRPRAHWIGLSENTRGVLPPARIDGDDAPVTDPARIVDPPVTPSLAQPFPGPGTVGPRRSASRSRARWRRVRDAADAVRVPRRLSAGELAGVAEALTDLDLRDYLYALASGPRRHHFLGLWTVLAGELPARQRAVAALLLAITHHTDNQPERARAALAAARTDGLSPWARRCC
ncbi:DUF4192 family protein [Nocardia takedensis]